MVSVFNVRQLVQLLAALGYLAVLIALFGSFATAASTVKISGSNILNSSRSRSAVDSMTQNLSTHILDTTRGKPAPEVPVTLYRQTTSQSWIQIGTGVTDNDGRFREFFSAEGVQSGLKTGVYKLHFEVSVYFRRRNIESLYPFIEIVFAVVNPTEHYHVPLLLNPFGYSTYRGS